MSLSEELTLPLPVFVTVTAGTPTLAADICAPTKSPSSPSCGALHRPPSAQTTSCVTGS
jgi:hypothetical protein